MVLRLHLLGPLHASTYFNCDVVLLILQKGFYCLVAQGFVVVQIQIFAHIKKTDE